MKNQIKLLGAMALAALLFFSCEKDEEDDKLAITDVIAENHDSGSSEIPRGGTVSVNFTATSGQARLDFYHIEIHDHPASGKVEDEYKIIDDDFKDETIFKGLREASVHKHVSVPDTANLGRYHVVIVVVDEAGYSVNTEDMETHITIVE